MIIATILGAYLLAVLVGIVHLGHMVSINERLDVLNARLDEIRLALEAEEKRPGIKGDPGTRGPMGPTGQTGERGETGYFGVRG